MKHYIKSNVNWVGKIDWELTKFHGGFNDPGALISKGAFISPPTEKI